MVVESAITYARLSDHEKEKVRLSFVFHYSTVSYLFLLFVLMEAVQRVLFLF